MNSELFTKIGMYIVVGTSMFCIGVLTGYRLHLFSLDGNDFKEQNISDIKVIHDDF